jgi:hypothetical protein
LWFDSLGDGSEVVHVGLDEMRRVSITMDIPNWSQNQCAWFCVIL